MDEPREQPQPLEAGGVQLKFIKRLQVDHQQNAQFLQECLLPADQRRSALGSLLEGARSDASPIKMTGLDLNQAFAQVSALQDKVDVNKLLERLGVSRDADAEDITAGELDGVITNEINRYSEGGDADIFTPVEVPSVEEGQRRQKDSATLASLLLARAELTLALAGKGKIQEAQAIARQFPCDVPNWYVQGLEQALDQADLVDSASVQAATALAAKPQLASSRIPEIARKAAEGLKKRNHEKLLRTVEDDCAKAGRQYGVVQGKSEIGKTTQGEKFPSDLSINVEGRIIVIPFSVLARNRSFQEALQSDPDFQGSLTDLEFRLLALEHVVTDEVLLTELSRAMQEEPQNYPDATGYVRSDYGQEPGGDNDYQAVWRRSLPAMIQGYAAGIVEGIMSQEGASLDKQVLEVRSRVMTAALQVLFRDLNILEQLPVNNSYEMRSATIFEDVIGGLPEVTQSEIVALMSGTHVSAPGKSLVQEALGKREQRKTVRAELQEVQREQERLAREQEERRQAEERERVKRALTDAKEDIRGVVGQIDTLKTRIAELFDANRNLDRQLSVWLRYFRQESAGLAVPQILTHPQELVMAVKEGKGDEERVKLIINPGLKNELAKAEGTARRNLDLFKDKKGREADVEAAMQTLAEVESARKLIKTVTDEIGRLDAEYCQGATQPKIGRPKRYLRDTGWPTQEKIDTRYADSFIRKAKEREETLTKIRKGYQALQGSFNRESLLSQAEAQEDLQQLRSLAAEIRKSQEAFNEYQRDLLVQTELKVTPTYQEDGMLVKRILVEVRNALLAKGDLVVA